MSLLEEAIAAHGGMQRWRELKLIELTLRCGGIAMALKGRPGVLRELAASVDVRRPHVQFDRLGTFDAADGRPCGITRRLRWSDQDVLYFTGYALWNYITAPFMLANDDVTVEELAGRRLRATFPAELPTHSRKQTFHLGQDGRITRLDYTAEVFGPWARAANHCLVHERVDGLLFATRRRVVARGVPGPPLVTISIDDITLH